jgi:acyl carrier protein
MSLTHNEAAMISDRLKTIILRELKLDDFNLTDETTAPQVPGWDSLAHLGILAAIEKDYGIRFKTLEVIRFKHVGDLQAAIDKKTGLRTGD